MGDWLLKDIERVRQQVARCAHPALAFEVKDGLDIGLRTGDVHVRACAWVADIGADYTGATKQNGRWWRLSKHMTDGEIAQTCLLAAIAFFEHEVREAFTVDGLAVFQPHWDLDALVAMAADRANTKERT